MCCNLASAPQVKSVCNGDLVLMKILLLKRAKIVVPNYVTAWFLSVRIRRQLLSGRCFQNLRVSKYIQREGELGQSFHASCIAHSLFSAHIMYIAFLSCSLHIQSSNHWQKEAKPCIYLDSNPWTAIGSNWVKSNTVNRELSNVSRGRNSGSQKCSWRAKD